MAKAHYITIAIGIACVAAIVGTAAYFSSWVAVLAAGLLGIYILCFQKFHYAITLGAFVFASTQLPGTEAFTVGRWLVLGFSAFFGVFFWISTKRHLRFGVYHALVGLTLLVILASATYSVSPAMTIYKGVGFAALLVYGAIGVRNLVQDHEQLVVDHLVIGTTCFVFAVAVLRWGFDYDLFFNPNNLGAATSVLAWPVIFWAAASKPFKGAGVLRWAAVGTCLGLIVASRSRASMLAASLSTIIILFALRRFKTLVSLVLLQAALLTLFFFYFQPLFDSLTVELVHKGDVRSRVLGSRDWVWEDDIDEIRKSPWIGSGFGVSRGLSEYWEGGFESWAANREKGNSYLALIEALGFAGSVPVVLALGYLVWGICKCSFGRRFPSSSFAIALIGVLSSGLINAFFEAWLFAPGFYLTTLFWTCAFVFDDYLSNRKEASERPRTARLKWQVDPRLLSSAPAIHVGRHGAQ